MSKKTDAVWKSESVVAYYLERKGSRPFLREQIDVMLTVIKGIGGPINHFMDLGCGDGILAAVILRRVSGLRWSSCGSFSTHVECG